MPVIIAAVIGLIILLVIMGKMFLKGPDIGATPPPSWIDPATNKPRTQMNGTTPTSPDRGGPSGSAPSPSGR